MSEIIQTSLRAEALAILHDRSNVQDFSLEQLKRFAAGYLESVRDGERLDWLEQMGFATISNSRIDKPPGVHCWRNEGIEWTWTAHWKSSGFKTARLAIDAAMSGKEHEPE